MGSANQKSSLVGGYKRRVPPFVFGLLLATPGHANALDHMRNLDVATQTRQLALLASRVLVSAGQEQSAPGTATAAPPPGSGKPDAGAPSSGTHPLTLFEIMPNFKVVESEVVEFDYYRFGYLPDTPRIEGRRTTVNYWLKEGSPVPGALGICRHFAEVTRQAGGEVLYDNNRNIITVRVSRAGRQTWAEFACDKDRYRVNIIEREGACERENCSGGQADASNIMKTKHDTVKNSISNVRNADELPAAAHNPGDPPPDILFLIEVDDAAASLAAAVPCADAPARIGTQPGTPDAAASRRGITKGVGAAPLRQGFVDQVRAAKLNLVDTNTWSCHAKDGKLVQGALIKDSPRK